MHKIANSYLQIHDVMYNKCNIQIKKHIADYDAR